MVITSRLPAPLNPGQLPLSRRQPDISAPDTKSPESNQRVNISANASTSRARFVMPNNATTRRGQLALQEYQTIQNGGEVELVNRVDVRV